MTLDMTRGKPFGLLVRFSLPLMLSSLLQQLYTMADSMIVGRLLGTDAFAAIGSVGYLHWFPLSMLLGATSGFGVALGHRFGAHDKDGFHRFFGASITLSLLLGVVWSVTGACIVTRLLGMINTPPELMDYATRYMRVLWGGLLVTAMLNMFTAALRSTGDSRTPFVSLIISTVLNIALDFAFIGWMNMGVEGAALATVLSQAAAAVWCVRGLVKSRAFPHRSHYRPKAPVCRELLRLGMPLLFSQGVIATGELAVLAAINSFGVAFVTGLTATRRYFSLFNIAGNALEGAVATYVAQNWGAGEKQRVTGGTKTAVTMGIVSSLTLSVLIFLFTPPLIELFIPQSSPDALRFGIESLRMEVLFIISLYLLCEYRAAIQGMGNTIIPMISGFLELVLRLLAAWLMPLIGGHVGLYFTDAVTWTPTAVFLIISYYVIIRRKGLK